MQLELKTIKKHFQKSIDKYYENAIVQKIMAEKLISSLPKQRFGSILEIGAGAGILTKELSGHIDFQKYFANDLVEKSEYYVKKYIPQSVFYAGDFRRINFKPEFDLIISNAVFQWFGNLDTVLEKCYNLLSSEGILAFSTFLPDNFKEFYSITGLSLDYKSLEDLTLLLKDKFDIISAEHFEYKMNFENPLQILAHMKNTGVNSLSSVKWSIREVKDFCEKYSRAFPELSLTYTPVILSVQKQR